jgi:S-adenosylmethionine synthetase
LILFPVANDEKRLGLKEIVIGLEHQNQYKTYKLQDIETKKLINDVISEDNKIALVSLQPFMIRVFDRVIENENKDDEIVVDLLYNETTNNLIDNRTNSKVNFDGKFILGPLENKQLKRLPMDQGFWFEWVAFHPETEVFSIK